MAGFISRYGFYPPQEVITQIEGVTIVDLPPPGSVNGVGTGTVAVVGEFADMKYGVSVAPSTGDVSTSPQAVEVFSGQDLLNKVGGFDATLGDTGVGGGNGFIAIRNKKFSRLVLCPVNLCSAKGVRLFRDLPTCKSATDPSPVVLVANAIVAAGREFKNGTGRVRTGTAVQFTSLGQYAQGVDGAVTAAGSPALTQSFSSAAATFLTANNGGPVKKGDILVLGVIGGAVALGANAFTFRVVADAATNNQLTLEKLDGTTFDWTSGVALPYRVHPSTDADSGGIAAVADVNGYLVPARPLDATFAGAIVISPTIVPPTPTATTWDVLANLKLRTMPTSGLTYTATIQAPNAANDATIDALYTAAIDALITDSLPGREVNIVEAARRDATINAKLKAHVLEASGQGMGRTTCISPVLTTLSQDTAIGDASPGVGAVRDERVNYAWPGFMTFVPEAVGFSMKCADGVYRTDGMLDTAGDMWLASVLSVLPPERNPGQATAPVPDVMSNVIGLQRGVTGLTRSSYIQFRAKGIVAGRDSRTNGFIFQSGVTTSLTSGQKNINRRRMADFIEDSLAQRYVQFTKLPLTNSLKDTITGETDAFLDGLLSPNNPAAQRINGYLIDAKSGNTPESEAKGIYVVISKVRTTPTADFIVIQAEIGENVKVTAA